MVGIESELAELGLLAAVDKETLEEGGALEPVAEQGRNRSRGGGPARQRRRKRAERAAAEGMAAAEGIAPQRGRQEQGNGAERAGGNGTRRGERRRRKATETEGRNRGWSPQRWQLYGR